MCKSNAIMLSTSYDRRIVNTLEKKNPCLGIFYLWLLETGMTAISTASITVSEMNTIIEHSDNFSIILQQKILTHIATLNDDDYVFTGVRVKGQPLSKRTYESAILDAGLQVGINNLGIKTITKASQYRLLKRHSYDYNQFTIELQKRGHKVPPLKEFLDSCGISISEYNNDVRHNLQPSTAELAGSLAMLIERACLRRNKLITNQATYQELISTRDFLDWFFEFWNNF